MRSEGVRVRIPVHEVLIISLITVVPISLAGLYSLSQCERSLRVTIGNDFSAIAGRTASEVSQFVMERVTEVGRLAAEPPLVDAVAAANKAYKGIKDDAITARIGKIDAVWNATPADRAVDEMLASRVSVWLRVFREMDPRNLRITVTDERGATIAATHKPVRYAQSDEEYWKDVYDDGKGAVSLTEIRYDEMTRADYIGIGWPVRDPDTNRFIGVVNALVDLSALSSIVNRVSESAKQRILLVKEDGTVIAGPGVQFAQRMKAQEYAAVQDAVGALRPKQTGYLEAAFRGGTSELIAYADTGLKQHYASVGWSVLVCQDARQALDAVRLVERMIWLTSLTGLAMVTLLLVYFAMHRKEYTDLHELTDKESPVEVAR
jgi:hypothetical protein